MTAMLPSKTLRRAIVMISALGYLLLLAPIVTVVSLSFLAPESPEAPLAPTLLWYQRLFADPTLGVAVWRSLGVAAATSGIATLIGTLGAIAIERGHFPGRKILEALALLPLILPELVLGIASLIWFVALRLSLGTYSIVLAHVTFALSYVVVTVRASLRNFDPALIDAARDLGCDVVRTYWRVVLPLILPGILGGGVMAFTLSFDDFLISFFTAGVGADTLPMRLYAMLRFGLNKEMYALSTLLIAATSAVVYLQSRLGGNLKARL